jgi:large subunit ribosomal protein L22
MSARKVRKFADLIRGKTLDEAVQLLRYVHNRGARLIEKVLLSAKGNAEDRGARDVEDLIVSESRVDDGPMFKRIMPRSRGTANMIFRRICHIHVALAEEEVEETATPSAPQITTTTPATTGVAPAPTVQTS